MRLPGGIAVFVIQGTQASGTAFMSIEFDYEGRHSRCASEPQTWTASRLP
jgi:hypothetical protein